MQILDLMYDKVEEKSKKKFLILILSTLSDLKSNYFVSCPHNYLLYLKLKLKLFL